MMTRKWTQTNGVTLSYLEQNETAAPTVFFIHGNSGTALMWQKQFSSSLFAGLRLIAFDLPAHGQSEGLEKQQYNLPHFALLLAAAVRQLSHGAPFLLVGFSFGANVVAEMLAQPVQPAGIALIGPSLIGGSIYLQHIGKEGGDLSVLFTDDAPDDAILKCFHDGCPSAAEVDRLQFLKGFKMVQAPFRSAILQSAADGNYTNEIELLQKGGIPVLIIFGADDQLINPDYLDEAGLPLWKERIYKIEGGSHFIQIDQPEAVNNLVHQYAQEVFTSTHASVHNLTAP